MTSSFVLSYLLIWGLIGCALFFTMVIVLFRTGLVYTARKPDGTLKDKIPLSGKLAMLIIPISFFAFPGNFKLYWPRTTGLLFEFLALIFAQLRRLHNPLSIRHIIHRWLYAGDLASSFPGTP